MATDRSRTARPANDRRPRPPTTRSASTARSSSRWPACRCSPLLWVAGRASSPTTSGPRSRPNGLNAGPLVVICFGMILAAFIDGWALKVPNWVTLPLVLSGWMLGLLHDFGVAGRRRHRRLRRRVPRHRPGLRPAVPDARDPRRRRGRREDADGLRGVGRGVLRHRRHDAAAELGSLHGLGVVFWAFCFGACSRWRSPARRSTPAPT